ncbi:MAG TPA: hypothetical protein VGD89_00895 [Flavipsychrobacter sp.]
MYVKNQKFKDEDTLYEVLFDFEIGMPSPYMQGIADNIAKGIDETEEIMNHLNQMQDEEERLELYDDIKRERIVKTLQHNFDSFEVKNAGFYGLSGKEAVLLYKIDLY